MADRQYIRYTIEERVATLVIDHPPANAFNRQTLTELDSALDELLSNSEVKAIIITGAGQMAFVAGADIGEINELVKSGDAAGAQAMIEAGQALFNKIERASKPIIAAIIMGSAWAVDWSWQWPATFASPATGRGWGSPKSTWASSPVGAAHSDCSDMLARARQSR